MFDEIGGEITCVLMLGRLGVGSERHLSREEGQHGDPGGASRGFFSSAFSVCKFSPTGREVKPSRQAHFPNGCSCRFQCGPKEKKRKIARFYILSTENSQQEHNKSCGRLLGFFFRNACGPKVMKCLTRFSFSVGLRERVAGNQRGKENLP